MVLLIFQTQNVHESVENDDNISTEHSQGMYMSMASFVCAICL